MISPYFFIDAMYIDWMKIIESKCLKNYICQSGFSRVFKMLDIYHILVKQSTIFWSYNNQLLLNNVKKKIQLLVHDSQSVMIQYVMVKSKIMNDTCEFWSTIQLTDPEGECWCLVIQNSWKSRKVDIEWQTQADWTSFQNATDHQTADHTQIFYWHEVSTATA